MTAFEISEAMLLLSAAASALAAGGWWRERRRADAAEQRLRRSEAERIRLDAELHRALRARATFLAAANHDLRQPLQALFCFSDILKRRLRGRSRAIVDNLQHALRILNGHIEPLVELSRLDAGVVTARVAPVAVGPLLEEVAAGLRMAAESQGLSLRVVPTAAVAESDAALLRKVLAQLAANAVRFTRTGGVLIGCRRRDGRLRIEVWDTGIGIAAEDIERVFDDFLQIGNPQRDRANGLGLGLAVVERVVRLLPGHSVEVRSTLGRGSVFALDLPLALAPAPARERPAPAPTVAPPPAPAAVPAALVRFAGRA